jgi:hypothetical protein
MRFIIFFITFQHKILLFTFIFLFLCPKTVPWFGETDFRMAAAPAQVGEGSAFVLQSPIMVSCIIDYF